MQQAQSQCYHRQCCEITNWRTTGDWSEIVQEDAYGNWEKIEDIMPTMVRVTCKTGSRDGYTKLEVKSNNHYFT